jgi:hypothetical protein
VPSALKVDFLKPALDEFPFTSLNVVLTTS